MTNPIQFSKGDGACMCYFTDRNPVTIIDVSASGRRVTVQTANWHIVEGSESNGSAKYTYSQDIGGGTTMFSLRKNGQWIRVGESLGGGTRLNKGYSRYYDPSF